MPFNTPQYYYRNSTIYLLNSNRSAIPIDSRYAFAWQVRAIAREGIEGANVFKNNRYSPIYWFDYAADCKTVESCGTVYENRHINITWTDVGGMEYTVEY